MSFTAYTKTINGKEFNREDGLLPELMNYASGDILAYLVARNPDEGKDEGAEYFYSRDINEFTFREVAPTENASEDLTSLMQLLSRLDATIKWLFEKIANMEREAGIDPHEWPSDPYFTEPGPWTGVVSPKIHQLDIDMAYLFDTYGDDLYQEFMDDDVKAMGYELSSWADVLRYLIDSLHITDGQRENSGEVTFGIY